MGRNQHVVPHDNLWAVKGVGTVKATRVCNTQHDAINSARKIAKNQGLELIVHGENGRIRSRDSYGNDPFSPKG